MDHPFVRATLWRGKEQGRNQHEPLSRLRGTIFHSGIGDRSAKGGERIHPPRSAREATNSHTSSRGPDPDDDETVLGPGQFDLRHFESEPTDRGRVLKRCDVGRVLRGPRGALHLAWVLLLYDGRDRWLCVWKPACELAPCLGVGARQRGHVDPGGCVGARGGAPLLSVCVFASDNLVIPVPFFFFFFVNRPSSPNVPRNRFEAAFPPVSRAWEFFPNIYFFLSISTRNFEILKSRLASSFSN